MSDELNLEKTPKDKVLDLIKDLKTELENLCKFHADQAGEAALKFVKTADEKHKLEALIYDSKYTATKDLSDRLNKKINLLYHSL